MERGEEKEKEKERGESGRCDSDEFGSRQRGSKSMEKRSKHEAHERGNGESV